MTWDEDKEYRGLIIKEIEGCMGNIHEYGLALAAGRRRKKRVYLQGFAIRTRSGRTMEELQCIDGMQRSSQGKF